MYQPSIILFYRTLRATTGSQLVRPFVKKEYWDIDQQQQWVCLAVILSSHRPTTERCLARYTRLRDFRCHFGHPCSRPCWRAANTALESSWRSFHVEISVFGAVCQHASGVVVLPVTTRSIRACCEPSVKTYCSSRSATNSTYKHWIFNTDDTD